MPRDRMAYNLLPIEILPILRCTHDGQGRGDGDGEIGGAV